MFNTDFPAEWTARWITPESRPPFTKERLRASYLRKSFTYEKQTGDEPVLFASAYGVYQIRLNGQPLAEKAVLAPFACDFEKRLKVQCYRVGALLTEGENRIEVVLGDGSWRGNVSTALLKQQLLRRLAFFAELRAGENCLLATDESWEATQDGPLFENDPLLGERYDARYEEPGLYFLEPVWAPVSVIKQPTKAALVQAKGPMVTEQEAYTPVLMKDAAGSLLLDFGKKISGYPRVHIPAGVCYPGEPLIMSFAAALSEDGVFLPNAYEDPDTAEVVTQELRYTCRLEANDYRPLSCYFSFRYIKLETTLEVDPAWFSAIAVYTDFPFTSEFSCGNEAVNALFAACRDRLKYEWVGQPTEGERRIGCAAHAQYNCAGALYLADCAASYQDWLEDFAAVQDFLGALPGWAPGRKPSLLFETPAGFDDAIVLIPWQLWQLTGSTEAAEAAYDCAKKWLAFEGKRLDRVILHHKADEREAAYRCQSLRRFAELAEVLGHEDDAQACREKAESVRAAYRDYLTERGRIFSDDDSIYVRSLSMGLLDRFEYPRVAQDLAVKLERRAFLPNTDAFAAPDLLRALAENGQTGIAYRVLSEQGAAAFEAGSLSPVSFLMDTVLGIRFEAGSLVLAPRPDRSLGHAEGAYESPLGRIESAWRYEGESLLLSFSLPDGVSAKLTLPNGVSESVSGHKEYRI